VSPDSGKAFYQSGFAGTVLSAERVNLTFSQVERDLVQGTDTRKSLGQQINLQYYVLI
jgi:hypothetical protein